MRRRILVFFVLAARGFGGVAGDLEVGVVDATDQPQAGVLLRLVLKPEGDGPEQELWRGSTDLAGRAVVPGPRDRFDAEFWREVATWHALWVEVLIPTPWPLAVQLPPERLDPTRTLWLGIPDTSTVRAEVIDRRGRPIEDAVVRLLGRMAPSDPWREMDERTTGGEGFVVFPHVPVGLDVLLHASGQRGRWQPAETTARSPARRGAEEVVRLHFRAPNTVFRVRLLDEDGVPLAGRRVWVDRRVDGVSLDAADVAMPGEPRLVGDDGTLDVRLDRAGGAGRAVSLVFSSPDPADESRRAGPFVQAVVDVTAKLEPGRVVLEPVRLRPLPRLAEGLVVAEDGAPVERAVVVVYADEGAAVPVRDVLGTITLPHPTQEGRYLVRHARTQTGADGRFTVRGSSTTHDLYVVVRRHAHEETAATRLVPGDGGLRFVLRPSAE